MRLLQRLLCKKELPHRDDDEDSKETKPDLPDIIMSSELDFSHLLSNVTRRLKVQRAAILDLHGNAVHVTSDLILGPDDGTNLKKMVKTAPMKGMWRFSVFGEDFRCFNCDDRSTVLGYSAATIMTAHKTRKYIVVGLAPEHVPGSCLHEMTQVWTQIESRGL